MSYENRELNIDELDLIAGGADNAKIAKEVIDNMKFVGAYVDTVIAIYSSSAPGYVHGVLI